MAPMLVLPQTPCGVWPLGPAPLLAGLWPLGMGLYDSLWVYDTHETLCLYGLWPLGSWSLRIRQAARPLGSSGSGVGGGGSRMFGG